MPQFILDTGAPDAAERFGNLYAFTRGYIEAMFFTNTGSADDEELEGATVADLAEDAWAAIERDCRQFQERAAALLLKAYSGGEYEEIQAGRDFWFTRNGHGVGFWDRPELNDGCMAPSPGGLGESLSELARQFGGADLYRGDDGKVYLS